jgi:hypothetical protein
MKKSKSLRRLYHGTTEIIAKTAPVKGLIPYEVSLLDNGKPRAIGASSTSALSITDSYAGMMAFDTCGNKERWGLLEINPDELDEKLFVPHELFLMENSKKKPESIQDHVKAVADYRTKLASSHKSWKDSLSSVGLCSYQGVIPAKAITKIVIYDWKSNWFITKEIFNLTIGSKSHKIQIERQKLLTRWLMCDVLSPSEWVSDYSSLTSPEKEPISSGLINKSGLDIYFQQPTGRWK